MENGICIVAIAKDEDLFVDEWVAYHRIIGVDHIYIYDDDPEAPLVKHFKDSNFVTVIPWYEQRDLKAAERNQVRAYLHALKGIVGLYEWVAFIDIDEFLVFREYDSIKEFLGNFSLAGSISLNWHVFGHNGYYDDPEDLITATLTRRMFSPSINVKTIARTRLIVGIAPDYCTLRNGKRVDANNLPFTSDIYHERTIRAHVNHYQCRSFKRWMKRAERGDVNFNAENVTDDHRWRLSEEECLKKFVTTVALDKNEFIDTYMRKYSDRLRAEMLKAGASRTAGRPKEHRSGHA